jgi:hypothetical protein
LFCLAKQAYALGNVKIFGPNELVGGAAGIVLPHHITSTSLKNSSMRRILLLAILCQTAVVALGQTVRLQTNGHALALRYVDSLQYSEFASDVAARKSADWPSGVALRTATGTGLVHRPAVARQLGKATYSTRFMAYKDGTLQAPTPQLFFTTKDLASFSKKYQALGTIQAHASLPGAYLFTIEKAEYRTGAAILGLCQEIYERGDVLLIEPVYVRLLKASNPLRPRQWNIRNNANVTGGQIGADMNVESAWNQSVTGSGIRVAVIDDGVDLTHPDLQANLLPGYDATGNNSGGAPISTNTHGTSCAGIIAAVNNTIGGIGVAYNAGIIPCRLGTTNSDGRYQTTDDWIVNCFNEAVARRADVISCSWGGGSPSAQIDAAIQAAVNNGRNGRGCVVLFSTGNDNKALQWPSTNSSVIAVGASTPCDTRKRSASTGTVGATVEHDPAGVSCDGEFWWGSNFGTGMDVLAPGVLIPTTSYTGPGGPAAGNYNASFNGTSAACPNAAGVVALILAANPNLTGAQARQILEQSCFKIANTAFQGNVAGQPNGTWNNQAGYGRVDAGSAVCLALGQQLAISGKDNICQSEVYTLNSPQGAAWSASPANLVTLTPGPGTNQVTVTRRYDGPVTLTAVANNGCGIPVSRQLLSGTENIPASYIIGGIPDNAQFCVGSSFNVYSSMSPVPATNWSVIGGSVVDGQGTIHARIQLDNSPGGYAVQVQYTDACGATRTVQLSGTKVADGCQGESTSTSPGAGPEQIQFYPNPVLDELTVALPTRLDLANTVISLTDMSGRTLAREVPSNQRPTLKLSDYPTGLYLLSVYENGQLRFVKKVAKQ